MKRVINVEKNKSSQPIQLGKSQIVFGVLAITLNVRLELNVSLNATLLRDRNHVVRSEPHRNILLKLSVENEAPTNQH